MQKIVKPAHQASVIVFLKIAIGHPLSSVTHNRWQWVGHKPTTPAQVLQSGGQREAADCRVRCACARRSRSRAAKARSKESWSFQFEKSSGRKYWWISPARSSPVYGSRHCRRTEFIPLDVS